MKRIVLPTDFSDNAWNAISYAVQLFANETCQLYFLHTYVPAFYRVDYAIGGPAYSGIDDAMIQATISGLENTVARVKEEYPNDKHTYHQHYAFNLLTDEVKELCEKEDIDLVIMGTKGATGAERILFGSNAVFMMRKIDVPLIVIPGAYAFKKPVSVLFPNDFLMIPDKEVLKPLLQLLKNNHAHLDVVHVQEDREMTRQQEHNKYVLHERLADCNYDFLEIQEGYMPDAIKDMIDEGPYDLLVMLNRKHSFLERLLLRQNVDSLGFEVEIPFMVLRESIK
ncbi:universal stress protein [Robertkochia flava]|uniref:universal stress protein n=1 Tax=Robertkochia flava TaxID=3447986 RepID=UPI001CCD49E2|nr:universal stress protein [Robertkochia marina]